ncbi:hypothetical protein PGB90_005842 [Kerria lacca]
MENLIPTSLERDILNTNLSLKSLINDIKNYRGSIEELQKLNEFGRIKISKLRQLIEGLQIYAHEQTDELLKNELLTLVENEQEQLYCTLKDFQKANVECMLCIGKNNTEELFTISNPEEVLKRRNVRNNVSLLQQNTEITDHMSTVSRQLAEIMKQNSGTLETLVKSSTNITGIQEELKKTGSIIDQSGKILNKYQQREFTDKILIIFAFVFFIACVLYVIYSRI